MIIILALFFKRPHCHFWIVEKCVFSPSSSELTKKHLIAIFHLFKNTVRREGDIWKKYNRRYLDFKAFSFWHSIQCYRLSKCYRNSPRVPDFAVSVHQSNTITSNSQFIEIGLSVLALFISLQSIFQHFFYVFFYILNLNKNIGSKWHKCNLWRLFL